MSWHIDASLSGRNFTFATRMEHEMAQYDRQTVAGRVGSAAAIDEGLRAHMLRVYNYMGIGLVLTGAIAYLSNMFAIDGATGQLTAWGALLYTTPLMWVVALSPLAFVLVLSFGINKLSAPAAQ